MKGEEGKMKERKLGGRGKGMTIGLGYLLLLVVMAEEMEYGS